VRREQSGPEGDLGSLSRINYSKIYTVENYVRVLNIGMVTETSLPALTYNSFSNLSPFNLSPPEPPSNPKSTDTTADKRNKNYKVSSRRAKAAGSRAHSMNSYAQSSVYDPEVSASIDLSESSDRLDDGKHIIHIATEFRVLTPNRIRNHKRTVSVFQERSGHQGSMDRACGQHLRI